MDGTQNMNGTAVEADVERFIRQNFFYDGPPLAGVASHRGHVDGVVAECDPANDSTASTDTLGWSGDSGDGAEAA